MSLKLMYITNDPEVAVIAQNAGVDRIWIDLEVLGKKERQGNIDSVKSNHTVDDISEIRPLLTSSDLLVRVNPINPNSKEEIDAVIKNGTDIVMLPMFRTKEEVRTFISHVNGRAKTLLLLETREAEKNLDEILALSGIDEVHIGLNDLHLAYKKKFMFELLTDGTVENLCKKLRNKGIPYGFGGIASIGQGALPAENIIAEHYRLGSNMAILSRSFCNTGNITDMKEIEYVFYTGVKKIRNYEKELQTKTFSYFQENQHVIKRKIEYILSSIA